MKNGPIQSPLRRPALSLIIPVYNVAPFLERCLASVEAQNLSGLELILVDDGSTDGSLSILERHAARFPECTRVVHCRNNGVSVARNVGLNCSTGQYVAFVDGDDWFEPDYYRRLLGLALRLNLDIAHGNATYHFDDDCRRDSAIYRDNLPPEVVMRGREVLRCRLRSKVFLHMVWMHVYRREFIVARAAKFVPKLIHQDVLWTTQAFLDAQRVAYDPGAGYYYRCNQWKTSPNPYDRPPTKVISSSVYNARQLAEIASAIDNDPELQRLLRWQLVDGALSIFHRSKTILNREVQRQLYWELRWSGIFKLLFENSQSFAQRRRVAKNWLKSLPLARFRCCQRQRLLPPIYLTPY